MRAVTPPLREIPTTYPFWEAPELGMGWATTASVVITVLMVVAICELIPPRHKAPPPLVTQARMVTLPPPPPPPPEVVQPPEPLQPPPITPPPEAPAPARIQVQKPPPKPIRHIVRHPPQHHVEPQPQTPPPEITAPRTTNPPPAPPVQNTSGVPGYARGLHNQIESNVEVPAAIQQLGLSGTAVVSFTITPSGSLANARIARSSGNPLIDRAALDAVRHTGFRAFTPNMPTQPIPFTVPIEITGSGGE